jgi:hypothetical protein
MNKDLERLLEIENDYGACIERIILTPTPKEDKEYVSLKSKLEESEK